jgi:glycosyltransferase involved in cell wall biosynthesis
MQDTSILIPTCRRPHFLEAALASVARQTALNRIGEVLVIENGEDRRSEDVCRKFRGLPIKYVFRNPVVPVPKLLVATMREAGLPFVAMLHDDDWWFDFHLKRSLEKLAARPDLSATYSGHFLAESENLWFQGLHGNFAAWFGNDQSLDVETRLLNYRQMLITSLLQSGFHVSSVVYRRALVEKAYTILDDGNDFDVDRTLAIELARLGDVLFFDTPSLVVRIHASQDSLLAIKQKRHLRFQVSTRQWIQRAQAEGIDICAELAARIARPGFDAQRAVRTVGATEFAALAEASVLPPPMVQAHRRLNRRRQLIKLFSKLNRWVQVATFRRK